MNRSHRHCPDCGAALDERATWPRPCAPCGRMHFLNPTPVAVLLIPVDGGLLAVRRAIPPGLGQLSLPGGYVDLGETWQQAAAREALEETGIMLEACAIELFDTVSAPDGTLLVYGISPAVDESALDRFEVTREVCELEVCREAVELAFPLHTEAMARWFRDRETSAPSPPVCC